MRIFAPHANAPLPDIGRVLLVYMPTYFSPGWERLVAGRRIDEVDFYALPFIRQVLISKSFVHHSRSNPRSVEYMLNMAAEFLEASRQNVEADLLLDNVAAKQMPQNVLTIVKTVWKTEGEGPNSLDAKFKTQLQARHFDTVLLLYPDPIGLGWSSLEKCLFALKAQHYIVLNGRRRVFALDAAARRKLLWRRALERSWLVEIALAIGLVAVSIPLTLYDLSLGKLQGRSARP